MAIDSKNLLVWVKAMSRGNALPLDASEVYDSLSAAESYAATAIAYPGQTVKAKLEDGKYHTYVLQPSDAGYVLEEVGIDQSKLKQYVQVVSTLPTTGQAEGVLYICGTDGSIWNGSEWKTVFTDLSSELDEKAPIANPVFTGTVKVGANEVATKNYVDGLMENLVSDVPWVLNSSDTDTTDPREIRAGETARVASAGLWFGHECEVGDLVIFIENFDYAGDGYGAGGANYADKVIVVQANIDGAVTSTADVTTVGEIVVFDATTGKVIKGSGIQLASLQDAISKAHTHTMTEAELLESAENTAAGLVANKANKATTLSGYEITDAYTKTEVDNLLTPITNNLNEKAGSTEAKAWIATAKEEALDEAATAAEEKINARVGAIDETETVKAYVDRVVQSGGTDTSAAIATAKQEAITTSKEYTDSCLAVTVF